MNNKEESQELPDEDNSVPDELDAQAPSTPYGDMVNLEVTAEDLAIRLMCWNLAQHNVMNGRTLVYIENDDEARDILEKEGFTIHTDNGLHSVGMGFAKNDDAHLRFQAFDRNLRMLAVRALHLKYARQDPPVEGLLTQYYKMAGAELARQKAQTDASVKH